MTPAARAPDRVPPAARLALGTAQLGMAYGVANRTGQLSHDGARALLTRARGRGVRTLDTAIAYGESEARLGAIGVGEWEVISKLPGLPAGVPAVEGWVRAAVAESARRLHVPRLYALLLHRPQDLLGPDGPALQRALRAVQADGLVGKLGVSVYDPAELAPLTGTGLVEIIQAPMNLLDRRLVRSGWLQRLHDAGTEVHVRSVFLQGLLLMRPRPARFAAWNDLWTRWDAWQATANVPALRACLHFVFSFPEIARVVVGVDHVTQLDEIIDAIEHPAPAWPDEVWTDDVGLLNPSRWPAA
jgi:aryl-alcohol dehydrogenase-like predicted oxidoreductase